MDDSDLIVETCNKEDLKCKNCKWSTLLGYLNTSCVKYERKPYDVYYEGRDCQKFEKRGTKE